MLSVLNRVKVGVKRSPKRRPYAMTIFKGLYLISSGRNLVFV